MVDRHNQQQNNPAQSQDDFFEEREPRMEQALTLPDASYRFDRSTITPTRPREVRGTPSSSLLPVESSSNFITEPFQDGQYYQLNNESTVYIDRAALSGSNQASQKASKSCSDPPTTTDRGVQTMELYQQQTLPRVGQQDPSQQMTTDRHKPCQSSGHEAQRSFLCSTEGFHATATPTPGSDFTVNGVATNRCDILYILNSASSQSRSQIEDNPSTIVAKLHQQAAKQHQGHRDILLTSPNTAPQVLPLPHTSMAPSIQKTEKEKMLEGVPFMPICSQLVDERMLCAKAIRCFKNSIGTTNGIVRAGGYVGSDVYVATPFYCEYGYNLSVGDNTVIGPNCRLLDSGKITIGRNAEIGAGVIVSTLKMPTNTKRGDGLKVAQGIYISDNVYIGNDCIIEAGLRIGHNAIVPPRSVVVHDIPAGCNTSGKDAQ